MLEQTSSRKLNINVYAFIALWTFGAVLGWMAVFPVAFLLTSFVLPVAFFPNWLFFAMMGGIIGMGASSAQAIALRLAHGEWIRGWFGWSFVGWVIGGMLMYGLDTVFPLVGMSDVMVNVLQVGVLTGVAAIFQAVILSRYVRNAWLWVGSVVSAASVFGWLSNTYDTADSITLAFGGYGFVTALVMLFLLLGNARPRFAAQSTATKTKSDERLRDAERHLVQNERADERYTLRDEQQSRFIVG